MNREELVKRAYAYGACKALQEMGVDAPTANEASIKLAMGATDLKAAIMQLLAQGKAGAGQLGGAAVNSARTMGTNMQGMGASAKNMLQSAGQKAQGLGGSAGEMLQSAGQKAQGLGGSAGEMLQSAGQKAQGFGQGAAGLGNQVLDFAKANPAAAATMGGSGAALGAGGALGLSELLRQS